MLGKATKFASLGQLVMIRLGNADNVLRVPFDWVLISLLIAFQRREPDSILP